MSTPMRALATSMASQYSYVWANLFNMSESLKQAGSRIKIQYWEGAGSSLQNAGVYARLVADYLAAGSGSVNTYCRDAFYWIDDNWEGGAPPGVTMPAILSAMVTAEYEELQQFIGIVDAYRVALWNEWFNVEYYAALARGFKR